MPIDGVTYVDMYFPPADDAINHATNSRFVSDFQSPSEQEASAVCIFELENTLIRCDDLRELIEAGVKEESDSYRRAVSINFTSGSRTVFSKELLETLRNQLPGVRFGIVSTSPRAWVEAVSETCWPDFSWDAIITGADFPTDLLSAGILKTFATLNASCPTDRVFFIGHSAECITAAYTASISAILCINNWKYSHQCLSAAQWNALNLFADAVIESPEDLVQIMKDPQRELPILELLLANEFISPITYRFLSCKKFAPRSSDDPVSFVHIHGLGRYFGNSKQLEKKRDSHLLTQSIQNNKYTSCDFPKAWIEAVSCFIHAKALRCSRLVITVVPPRPGRMAHLICFLREIAQSGFFDDLKATFAPRLLAFKASVKDSHCEYMTLEDRFENMGQSLYVEQGNELADHPQVVVIDDCVISGATLYHATRRLKEAGSSCVLTLALSLSINLRSPSHHE